MMLLGALLESYPDEFISGYLVDAYITGTTVTGRAYKTSGYSTVRYSFQVRSLRRYAMGIVG